MKVHFKNVGGFNMQWTAEVPEITFDNLYKQVKSKGAIYSRDIDFKYNDETKTGEIIVGMFRKVGTFEVVDG